MEDILERLRAESVHGNPMLRQASDEIGRLRAELDYAYRCVSSGYNQGVFDFSVLRQRALDHVAAANAAVQS